MEQMWSCANFRILIQKYIFFCLLKQLILSIFSWFVFAYFITKECFLLYTLQHLPSRHQEIKMHLADSVKIQNADVDENGEVLNTSKSTIRGRKARFGYKCRKLNCHDLVKFKNRLPRKSRNSIFRYINVATDFST